MRRPFAFLAMVNDAGRKVYHEMEIVREFTYLGDRVSAGGGCEAAVTARTRYVWVKFRECSELLYGKWFLLMQNGAVCGCYVRPSILYGS